MKTQGGNTDNLMLPVTEALVNEQVALAFELGLNVLVLDFETFYGTGYSLSNKGMTYDGYCFDDRFQAITCGFIEVNSVTRTFNVGVLNGRKALEDALKRALENKLVLTSHNNFFDAMVIYRLVSAEVRAILPRLRWACTQMLAKQFHPQERHSLAKLATRYKLPDKGKEVENAFNKRREHFTPAQTKAYVQYCLHDCAICLALFVAMYSRLTNKQKFLIAWHHWMYIGPQLTIDAPRLRLYEEKLIEEHKQRLLSLADDIATEDVLEKWREKEHDLCCDGDAEFGQTILEKYKLDYVSAELNSAEKFANILRWLGVDPPMKVSKTTGKKSYAFNKSTKEFTDLMEHDDELVCTVVAARLGIKSSILRTRTRRLIEMAERTEAHTGTPWAMIAISYYGALTGRGSGTNSMNPQNLTRGSELRKALTVPPGYKVVVADSSNIEMRIAHCIARQTDTIQRVRNGEDLYCWFAGKHIFNEVIEKVDKPKSEWTKEDKSADEKRFVGKVAMLSLQYGAGPLAFQRMLWAQRRLRKDEDFCKLVVQAFRSAHPQLRSFTTVIMEAVLAGMAARQSGEICATPYATYDVCEVDGVTPVLNFHDQNRARMSQLRYPNLIKDDVLGYLYGELKQGYWVEIVDEENGDSWFKFESDKEGEWWPTQRIYNGGLLENICQTTANVVLTDVIFNVFKKYGAYPALQVHDELVYVVKEELAEKFKTALLKEMCMVLPWWPALPLGAEAGVADNYGGAK